jgi:hypothetical protein
MSTTQRGMFRQVYPPEPQAAPAKQEAPARNWDATQRVAGLKKASEIPAPPPKQSPEPPTEPKGGKPVGISTEVVFDGMVIRVAIEMPLTKENLRKFKQRLKALGLEPQQPQLVWTAEGLPICPRHQVVMFKHEKQGDIWFSHKVTDNRGKEQFCRGCAGKSSPGWEIQ